MTLQQKEFHNFTDIQNNNRNSSLDILKFICALLVIFIHTPQPERFELIIDPLQRCSVPVFFMISGYFTFGRRNLNKVLTKRSVSILKIICWSSFIYLVYNIIHTESFNIIHIVISNIRNLILYNCTAITYHLWYIHAYLYVIIIFWIVNRYNLYKPLIYATPILIIAGLYFGKYHEVIAGNSMTIQCSRNFLFTGLPYFTLGFLIKKHETLINRHISRNTALTGFVLFLIAGSVEEFTLDLYDNTGDLYITTVFISATLFILFLNTNSKESSFASRIGREDSLYIYILHIIVFNEISSLMATSGYDHLFQYTSMLLVLISTILLIKILRKLHIIGRFI